MSRSHLPYVIIVVGMASMTTVNAAYGMYVRQVFKIILLRCDYDHAVGRQAVIEQYITAHFSIEWIYVVGPQVGM